MTRTSLAYGPVLACLLSGIGSADAQTAGTGSLLGEWHGEMQCLQRRTPLTFSIHPDGEVIVSFEAPEGRPNFRGTYRTTARDNRNKFSTAPQTRGWIGQPAEGYAIPVFVADEQSDRAMTGRAIHPLCTTFNLRRTSKTPAPLPQ
jgi:hypothetical protein